MKLTDIEHAYIEGYQDEIEWIAEEILNLAKIFLKAQRFQDLNSAIRSVKGDIRYQLEPIMARNKSGKEE